MKRSQVLLSTVAVILVFALFYVLGYQPRQEELRVIESDIVIAMETQAALTAERDGLRGVRERAPEIEADLTAMQVVVPDLPSQPSLIRQLQAAAEDSGIVMTSLNPTRMQQLPDRLPGLSSSGLSVEVQGQYFQVVDFLRRIQDPQITGRGILWNDMSVSRDEYPALNVSLSGLAYALLPVAPADPVDTPVDATADPDADPDADPAAEDDAEDAADNDAPADQEVEG